VTDLPENRIRQAEARLARRRSRPHRPAGDSPQRRLLRVAQDGGFEALVAAAAPAEPAAMVTPEERDAALQAAGQRPAPAQTAPEAAPATQPAEPPPAPPPPETDPLRFWEGVVRWVPVSERPPVPREPRRALIDYDPLADA
jgi:hypothetical protein